MSGGAGSKARGSWGRTHRHQAAHPAEGQQAKEPGCVLRGRVPLGRDRGHRAPSQRIEPLIPFSRRCRLAGGRCGLGDGRGIGCGAPRSVQLRVPRRDFGGGLHGLLLDAVAHMLIPALLGDGVGGFGLWIPILGPAGAVHHDMAEPSINRRLTEPSALDENQGKVRAGPLGRGCTVPWRRGTLGPV